MPTRTEKYWSDDLPSPHHRVSLLARSQSRTFQFSLARILPSCFRSSCLICHGITVLNIVLSMCSSGIPTTLYTMGKTRGKEEVSVRLKVINAPPPLPCVRVSAPSGPQRRRCRSAPLAAGGSACAQQSPLRVSRRPQLLVCATAIWACERCSVVGPAVDRGGSLR